MILKNWKRLLTGILCVSLVLSETALMGIRSYAAETDGTADTLVMEEAGESTEKEESEAAPSDDLGENEIDSSETVSETGTGLETQGTETEAAEQDIVVSEEESNAEGTEAEPAESEGTVTGEEIPEETTGEVVNDAGTELSAEELLKLSPEDRLAAMASEDDIASGISNDIVWVIDADEKLTVIGTGDYMVDSTGHPPWYEKRQYIKEAKIIATGMTSASRMFRACPLSSLDVSEFDTSHVTDMHEMFASCSSLSSLDWSRLDTSHVTDMSAMFFGCVDLSSLDLSGLDTSHVTDMHQMFAGCSGLSSLDLSGFATDNVTDMGQMFAGCSSLSSLNLNGFDTSHVTNMNLMFESCSALNSIDVSGFDTGNVTNMGQMFLNCKELESIDLSGFDLSKVTSNGIGGMLDGCDKLTTINTPYTTVPMSGLYVKLPKENAADIWYRSDGTDIEGMPILSYSITVGKNYIPNKIYQDDIIVNGKGYAYANFILKNNEGRAQKNTKMAYSFDGESYIYADSDENGLITIKSPLLENTSGKEEKQKIQTIEMILYYDSGETEKLDYSVIMDVTVIPLSFTQTWELGVEGTLTGSVSEGAGANAGVAKVEAELAKAEISGTLGGTLSVEHAFENGVRNLTLQQSYDAKIAVNAEIGPAAEAGVLGKELEGEVISAGAGASSGGSVGIGLTLENYDPSDTGQLAEIGKFILASQAQASGNMMLLRLAELAGVDFYNLEQWGVTTSVEAGADVGHIEFGDNVEGTLASAGAEQTITFDATRNKKDSTKELAFGYELGVAADVGELSVLNLTKNIFSASQNCKLEMSAEFDGSSQIQNFTIKKEEKASEGFLYETGMVETVAISYGRRAVEQIENRIGVVKDFISGSTHYVLGDAQKELFEKLDAVPVKGTYSSTESAQKYVTAEFDLGLELVLGVEAGVGLEGVYSCEYETAGGTYESGQVYITNTNEIEDQIKENSYSIVQLVEEPLTTVAESLWDFLVDAYGSVKDGIQNALAELRQSLSETAEGAKDWLLHIIALKKDNAASTEQQSYAITAYRTERTLERTADAAADTGTEADEYKVYTVGDPYCVYVTDQAGNEITDYSVNPLTLTLRYTDEMLLAAGIDRTQVNNLAIYMYSEEVYGYVCIGGTVDAADGSVSVEITEPGQYVLAADGAAPAVKDIKISKNTYKPVITVTFSEASGFQDFSMKLDGEEVIGAADWKKHYNKVYNSFSYQVEKELAVGKHTCSVYAVDTAGNAMSAPYETEFYIEAPKYTVTFDADDGTAPIKVTVAEGEKVTMPENPIRKGYVFKGWYTGKDGQGTEFTAQSEVTADMTVYACWLQMEQGDVLTEDIPADGIIPDGIWAAGIVDVSYTGTAVKQSFRLYDGRKRLKEKTDYTVSYKNNKAAYTYTDADYKAFEENQKKTGQSIAAGTFDPKKAPQAVIRMKGNYSGKRILYFRIEPVELSEAGYEADSLTVTYTGKKQTPVPKLVWNGKTLKYGTDFRIPEYDQAKNDKAAFKESREYSLTLTGMKNFKGEIPVTLTISKSVKQIAMNKVAIKGIKNMPWTGQQVTQTGFTVKYKDHMLSEENGDYTVQWGANTDAGTGTVIFTGTGEDRDGDGFSFVGTRKVSFKITGKSMSKVSVSGVEKDYTYTGTQIMPAATLTYKENKNAAGITLTEGVHYKVTYQKNEEKGTATILFTGLGSGGFTGTKKQTFKITAQEFGDDISISFTDTENVKDGSYTAPYMKGGAKPQVTVTSGTKTLQPDKDYKVSYQNNKKLGLATDAKAPVVIITGKGNYKGSKSAKFSIAAKPLSNENGITIVAKDKAESTKKNGYMQSFKVYDADGTALGSGDYEAKNAVYTLIQTKNADGTVTSVNQVLDKDSVVPAGSVIRITVQGKGIYAGGEAAGTYRIIENSHDISKATIQISSQTYTGEPVLITKQSQFSTGKVFIKLGGVKKELVLGEDIEVVPGSYIRNVNKGTAKVTFRGINDFGGTKTVSYKIGTRSITDVWQGIYAKMAGFFRE